MLRSLLPALAAAAGAFFAIRLLFAPRISVVGNTHRIRLDCGEDLEYDYPEATTTTTVVIKVLRTCSGPAVIRVGAPPWEEVPPIRASILVEGQRRDFGPERGTIWFVAVPAGQALRLECPGTGTNGCEFELTQIADIGRTSTKVFETPAPVACGAQTHTRIFNRAAAVKVHIVWSSICATVNGPSAPSVTISSIDPPSPGVGDTTETTKARAPRGVPADRPQAEWRKTLDPGRTLDVTCGAGDRGACRFTVSLVTGAGQDVFVR